MNPDVNPAIAAPARIAVVWQLLRPSNRPHWASDVSSRAIDMLAMPEEECGLKILDAICGLIRGGRVACNTASDDGRDITIGCDTMLIPLFAVDPML